MADVSRYSVAKGRGVDRYSRENSADRYAEMVKGKRKRSRALGIIVKLLIALLLVLGGLMIFRSCSITARPFYMVLLGTDESLARNMDTSEESLQGVYRTDTMILARIDPVEKKATLISLPRDTKVELPGQGTQKLNAAFTFGGRELAIQTIEGIAGVPVSHYAIVDMDGLRAVVDAVGGIEVEVPMVVDDPDAEGYLDAGWQTLTGEQALVLCRSRNIYEYYGSPDGMRSATQRMVLKAIANKILASDPATQANAVAALSDAVDTDLSVTDIALLAQALSGMDTATSLYTGVMPTEAVYEDDLWYEVIIPDAWSAMMERVDAGLPPTEEAVVDENTGIVISGSG